MTKKSLLTDLVALLDPLAEAGVQIGLPDLLMLAASFLKKLCLYEENTAEVRALGLVTRLGPLLPCSHAPVVNATLRLLFNLSFDIETREQMLQGGLVPRLIALLSTPSYRSRALKLLYHLSQDDRCKAEFARPLAAGGTGAAILTGLVVNFPQATLPAELGSLAVNVSLVPLCAELMAASKGLSLLVDRLTSGELAAGSASPVKGKAKSGPPGLDIYLLKIIRNIAMGSYRLQQRQQSSRSGLQTPVVSIHTLHSILIHLTHLFTTYNYLP